MALIIRLQQKITHYKIVVVDHKRKPNSGKIRATLGIYNPHTKKVTININRFVF